MAETYIVQQGDSLSSIADHHRIRNPMTIWEHPKNEELRMNRQSPDILYPGDEVYIPDKIPFKRKISINKVNVIKVPAIKPDYLEVKVFDYKYKSLDTIGIKINNTRLSSCIIAV